MKSSSQRGPSVGGRSWARRVFRYAPLACWLALSFWLSTDALSPEHTARLVRPLLEWLVPGISEDGIDLGHAIIRKGAHVTEYAVFALLLAWPLTTSSQAWLRRWWFVIGVLALFVLSLADEFHQTFVPTRHASFGDCLIDTTSGLVILTLLALWRRRLRRREIRAWDPDRL